MTLLATALSGWRLRSLRSLRALLALFITGCSSCGKNAAKEDPDAMALIPLPADAGDGGSANAGDGGSALDDTAMPAATGDDLTTRMGHIVEAVAQDNPDLAQDAMFPRDGYVASSEASDPAKAWEKKVQQSFRRAVERTHKHMKGIEHAKFVSFELGKSVVQLTPSKKTFKKPLWRVKHSKVHFTVDGKTRQLEVSEMTAWRGAWYVTRLR